MTTAIWGEPESQSHELHPSTLLKQLLQQMMVQFGATGACIALYNESINRMEIRLHVRIRGSNTTPPVTPSGGTGTDGVNPSNPYATTPLRTDPSTSALVRLKRASQGSLPDELEEVTPQKSDLFPVGTAYPNEKDLIGYVWHKNETYIMRHEDYLSFFYSGPHPMQADIVPTWYLVAPIQEPTLVDEAHGKKKHPQILGIVILYQTVPGAVFQQKQRSEALHFAERIALYLRNDQLRRRQHHISDYLQELQEISTAFPASVHLATLLEKVHDFVANLVDASSMLITFYDRDTRKIYDVFAIDNGNRVEGIAERPLIASPEERPVWWQLIHEERRKLELEPARLRQKDYDELLTGAWGDQRKAESFLLLPMKMLNRVTGSLALTSMHLHAYKPEEMQVLETMVQIITISIENAKLYERSRQTLREAKQREELLAAMNSTLQSISTVLNTTELLHKFVESATRLIQVEMSIFFQLTPDKQHLIAQAAYETTKTAPLQNNGNSLTPPTPTPFKEDHNDLIEKIRIPFKDSDLEHLVS